MNLLRAKRIRDFLDSKGIDPTERVYETDYAGTVRLSSECGRSKYQTFKKYVGLNGRPHENVKRACKVQG